jgi:ribosome-interacting GTPase 1
MEELELLDQVPHYVPVSAADQWNLDGLLETVWEYCKMIRIYTKPKGMIPDYSSPVILHDTAPTVGSFCDRLHRQLRNQLKYAWVWGKSVKHQPQKVGLSHVLHDEDVVQLVKKV